MCFEMHILLQLARLQLIAAISKIAALGTSALHHEVSSGNFYVHL